MGNSNLVLYAVWSAGPFIVTFTANGGTGSDYTQEFTHDKTKALSANTFTRYGYDFSGWSLTENGAVAYVDEAEITMGASSITLYAKWSAISYDITHNLDGGSNNVSNPASYTIENSTITLADPSKAGHTFGGWFSDSGFTTPITEIPSGSTGIMTLYAQWTINSYTITFNANEGTGSNYTQEITYNVTETLSANTFSRASYDFVGWALSEKGAIAYVNEANITMGAENIILFARWNNASANPASDFTYTIDDDQVTLTKYTGSGNALIIPDLIDGYPVTYFYQALSSTTGVFSNTSVTSVSIPDSMLNIGSRTFSSCSSLTSVTIPNSVTSIGDGAFYYCNILSSVTIPDPVTSIGNNAFTQCFSLSSITIPDSVTTIGYGVFEMCSSLTTITIPSSVTSIAWKPTINCTSLTSINVDASNSNYCSVEGVLFNKDMTELIDYPAGKSGTNYIIPDTVTSIANRSFAYAVNLTTVVVPDSVDNIDYRAFYQCGALESVTISDSVTDIEIEDSVFFGCNSLTSISVDADNPSFSSVDGVFFNKAQTRLIWYPGAKAGSYIIPSTVTSIGNNAFIYSSGLSSVTIPALVTSIGESAFSFCSNLASVYVNPTTPPSLGNSYVFDHNASGRIIYVPVASEATYEGWEYWDEYETAIEPQP